MEIDQKISEVKEYFSKRIVDRDFELTHVGDYTATIHFGEEYFLEVWIGNGLTNLAPYWHFDSSIALSIFPDEFSEEEKGVLTDTLTSYSNRKMTHKELKEKRAQIRKLTNEVKELEDKFNNKI